LGGINKDLKQRRKKKDQEEGKKDSGWWGGGGVLKSVAQWGGWGGKGGEGVGAGQNLSRDDRAMDDGGVGVVWSLVFCGEKRVRGGHPFR